MPQTVKEDLCEQSEIGRRLFDCFVKERVQSGKVNLWSSYARVYQHFSVFFKVCGILKELVNTILYGLFSKWLSSSHY